MKVTQLQIHSFGKPDQLVTAQVDLKSLGKGQLMVKTAFAGVNPIDAKTRAGLGWAAEHNKEKLPWTPGYDMSGVVESCFDGAGELQPGDRVCGLVGFPLVGGCYSEVVIASEQELVKVPEQVAMQSAAALPLAGLTAWQGLFEHGGLVEGETVLIHAAAGGVGHIAVQLAKSVGAKVIATASANNHDYLSGLGVDLVIDYRSQDVKSTVKDVDLVLDLVGGQTGIDSLACLKPHGKIVTVPTITAQAIKDKAEQYNVTALGMLVKPNKTQLQRLVNKLDEGQLLVHVAESYPLSEAPLAHQQIESGHTRGKVLLRP